MTRGDILRLEEGKEPVLGKDFQAEGTYFFVVASGFKDRRLAIK